MTQPELKDADSSAPRVSFLWDTEPVEPETPIPGTAVASPEVDEDDMTQEFIVHAADDPPSAPAQELVETHEEIAGPESPVPDLDLPTSEVDEDEDESTPDNTKPTESW